MRLFFLSLIGLMAEAIHISKQKVTIKGVTAAAVATESDSGKLSLAAALERASHGMIQRQAPGDEREVDQAGYEADWGTEHRSESYPEASKGLQNHPDYGTTVKVEVERQLHGLFGLGWSGTIYVGALLLAIAASLMYYIRK